MDVGGDSETLVVRADIVWEQIWSKYIYISDLINTNPSGSNAKPAAASLWLHKEFAVFRMLLCNQSFACKITRLFALPDVPLQRFDQLFPFSITHQDHSGIISFAGHAGRQVSHFSIARPAACQVNFFFHRPPH